MNLLINKAGLTFNRVFGKQIGIDALLQSLRVTGADANLASSCPKICVALHLMRAPTSATPPVWSHSLRAFSRLNASSRPIALI